MKNKIFLTSALIMGFACPAFADTFPSDGNMLENKTYTNAATYTNTGVYEGSVNASATYSDNQYTVTAGHYLPAASEDPTTTCTAGNYCPGLQSQVYYNANAAQGLNACPSGYTNSATGATANTDCYRTCSTSDVAHSATVSGQMYYNGTSGDGVNACEPATCVNGWHRKAGLNLTTTIGTGKGQNYARVNTSGTFSQFSDTAVVGSVDHDQAFYGLTANNTWAVYYDTTRGMVNGTARCSTQPGVFDFNYSTNELNQPITTVSSLTDETGQNGAKYCYCNVTGYTPAGGTLQSVSSSWVFRGNVGVASSCASVCSSDCAAIMRIADAGALVWRAALLGSVTPTLASCEANTINITWNDADAEDIAATGAATTVYEGDIKTPLKAITKPGKTFVGWKFVKPQQ